MNEDDFAAAAARTIRLTTASFGRLVGGALAMPTIARVMGAALLRLSHVIPLVRAIIAPREQPATTPASAVGLLGLWNNFQRSGLFGRQQQEVLGGGKAGALGAKVLSGLFLTTTREWAMSDPVWCVVLCVCLEMNQNADDVLFLGGGTFSDSRSSLWLVDNVSFFG